MHVHAPGVPADAKPAARVAGGLGLLALLAGVLDALGVAPPGALAPVRWLELAALAGLVTAALVRRHWRHAFATPLDGRIAGMLAVLLLSAVGRPAALESGGPRMLLAGLACYYAVSALVARAPAAFEAAWVVFPGAAFLLGLHALWAVTSGLAHLAREARVMDAQWGAPGALFHAIAFATLLTLGRALERGAPPAWRLAAVVGATATALHVAASGLPFDGHAFGRLESPLEFSVAVVVVLVLHGLGCTAWAMRCERPGESARWWGAIAGNTLLGAWLVFGTGGPGEGLALLAAFSAALVAAAPSVPRARREAPAAPARAPLRRAA